jgi:hypothetical protein
MFKIVRKEREKEKRVCLAVSVVRSCVFRLLQAHALVES